MKLCSCHSPKPKGNPQTWGLLILVKKKGKGHFTYYVRGNYWMFLTQEGRNFQAFQDAVNRRLQDISYPKSFCPRSYCRNCHYIIWIK